MVTWRELILKEMERQGDCWDLVVDSVGGYHENDSIWEPIILSDGWLDVKFDNGYGGTNGAVFTLWTTSRVYFPICYDGAEWCGSAPRNPNGIATEHQGG